MKLAFVFLPVLAYAASAPEAVIPPRTTPPTITTISPMGAPQGATTTFRIDGSNLADATAVFFSQPGIKARITKIETLPAPPDNRLGSAGLKSTIDLGPVPARNIATIEVDIDPTVELGPVALRLQTPLGLTTAARFMVEPHYPEIKDKEPNDDRNMPRKQPCPPSSPVPSPNPATSITTSSRRPPEIASSSTTEACRSARHYARHSPSSTRPAKP